MAVGVKTAKNKKNRKDYIALRSLMKIFVNNKLVHKAHSRVPQKKAFFEFCNTRNGTKFCGVIRSHSKKINQFPQNFPAQTGRQTF